MTGTDFGFIDVKRDKRCEEVKWRKVFAADVDTIQQNEESQEQIRKTLNGLLPSILYGRINENEEKENNIQVDNTLKKAFRLAQLSSQYLYHCQEVLQQRSDALKENIQDTVETLQQAHKKFTKRKETRRQLRKELKQIDNLIAQYDVTLKTLFPEVAKKLVKNTETGEVELQIPVDEGECSKANKEIHDEMGNNSKSDDVSYIRKLSQEYSTYLRWERKVKKIEEEAKQGKELKKKLQECEELIERLKAEKNEQKPKGAVSTGTSTSPILLSPENISTENVDLKHRTDSENKVPKDNRSLCETNVDWPGNSNYVSDTQPTDNEETQKLEIHLNSNGEISINEIELEKENASNKGLITNTSIDNIENESEYATNKRENTDTNVNGVEKESSNKRVNAESSINDIEKESEYASNKRTSADTSIDSVQEESEYASYKRVIADTSIDDIQKESEYASYKRATTDTSIDGIDSIVNEAEYASNQKVSSEIIKEDIEKESEYCRNNSVSTYKSIEPYENEFGCSSNKREQTLRGKEVAEEKSRSEIERSHASSYENVDFDDDVVNFELTTSNEFLHQIQKSFNGDDNDIRTVPQNKNMHDDDDSNFETKISELSINEKDLQIEDRNIEDYHETESYSNYNPVLDADSSDDIIERGNADAHNFHGTGYSVYGNEKELQDEDEHEESLLDNSRASHYSVGPDSLEVSQHQFGVRNSIIAESEEFKVESATDVYGSLDPLETTSLVGISENSETGSTLSMRFSDSNSLEDSLEVNKGGEDGDMNILDEVSDAEYFEGELYAEAIRNRII